MYFSYRRSPYQGNLRVKERKGHISPSGMLTQSSNQLSLRHKAHKVYFRITVSALRAELPGTKADINIDIEDGSDSCCRERR